MEKSESTDSVVMVRKETKIIFLMPRLHFAYSSFLILHSRPKPGFVGL